jgi:sRNA-binding regulator protein Hfq
VSSFKDNRPRWENSPPPDLPEDEEETPDLASTGSEAGYFRSLVDSKAKVTVVLRTGERFRGRVRYYDRYCFSIGPAGGGRKIFIRKSSVKYILEGDGPAEVAT